MKKQPQVLTPEKVPALAEKVFDTLTRIQALKGQLMEEIVVSMSARGYEDEQATKVYVAKENALNKACGRILSALNKNELDMVNHLERRGFFVKLPVYSIEHAVEEISRL